MQVTGWSPGRMAVRGERVPGHQTHLLCSALLWSYFGRGGSAGRGDRGEATSFFSLLGDTSLCLPGQSFRLHSKVLISSLHFLCSSRDPLSRQVRPWPGPFWEVPGLGPDVSPLRCVWTHLPSLIPSVHSWVRERASCIGEETPERECCPVLPRGVLTLQLR